MQQFQCLNDALLLLCFLCNEVHKREGSASTVLYLDRAKEIAVVSVLLSGNVLTGRWRYLVKSRALSSGMY